MRHLHLFIAIVMVFVKPLGLDAEVQNIDIKHWTDPYSVSVAAADGKAELICRNAVAYVHYFERPEPDLRPLDILYDPTSRALWVGEQYQKYCRLDDKIYALSQTSTKLRVRLSKGHVTGVTGEALAKGIERFKAGFRPVHRDEDFLMSLDMWFGDFNVLRFGSEVRSNPVEFTDLKVEKGRMSMENGLLRIKVSTSNPVGAIRIWLDDGLEAVKYSFHGR